MPVVIAIPRSCVVADAHARREWPRRCSDSHRAGSLRVLYNGDTRSRIVPKPADIICRAVWVYLMARRSPLSWDHASFRENTMSIQSMLGTTAAAIVAVAFAVPAQAADETFCRD